MKTSALTEHTTLPAAFTSVLEWSSDKDSVLIRYSPTHVVQGSMLASWQAWIPVSLIKHSALPKEGPAEVSIATWKLMEMGWAGWEWPQGTPSK